MLGLHCCEWASSRCNEQGPLSSCDTGASHCGGISCGTWALEHGPSNCDSWALECRLSNCGTWAWLPHGMWKLPGPVIEPMSPALAGGFLTTGLPGKSTLQFYIRDLRIPRVWYPRESWNQFPAGTEGQLYCLYPPIHLQKLATCNSL